MQKKNYQAPESDTLLLHMEGTLCESVNITDNNDISFNDLTETPIDLTWNF